MLLIVIVLPFCHYKILNDGRKTAKESLLLFNAIEWFTNAFCILSVKMYF